MITSFCTSIIVASIPAFQYLVSTAAQVIDLSSYVTVVPEGCNFSLKATGLSMVSVNSPTNLSVYQEDPYANLGTNTISLDFVSDTLDVKTSFILSTMTTCSNILVTFPPTLPQTYTVGDPANLYRIHSFIIGPNPNCGPTIYYYNIKYADTGQPAATSNYYMFNTTVLNEEPTLQVGQYYPTNNLMSSSLQLNLLVNLYVQVGMF
jgi:hypothetical protein